MAKLVLTNPSVTVAGIDLSQWITNVVLETKYDILDTTTFGSGSKTRVAGLADNSVQIDWIQDFASSSVEATIYPLLGTAAAVVIQPVAGSASTSNPKFTVSALISEWTPLNGGIGQLSTAKTSWPVSGAITKAFA